MGSLEYSNFTHDAQNRLTGWTYSKTTGETGSAAYAYDDSGARVTRIATKTGLAPESVTTVDPEYEVDHNRQRTRAHLFVAGARVATLERQAPAPASGSATPVLRELHYHADRLGTPRLITDGTGAVVQRTFPKPFGELWKVVDGTGNDIAPSSRASQHLFTGQHADVESGLHYFGARTYDPLVGRFLEVDPELVGSSPGVTFERLAGDGANADPYVYALNRPTGVVDRDGRVAQVAVGAAIGFGVSLGAEYWRTGGDLSAVNWVVVATATGAGALTGGISILAGSFSLGAGATAASVATAGAASAAVSDSLVARSRGEPVLDLARTGTAIAIGGVTGALSGGVSGMLAPAVRSGVSSAGQAFAAETAATAPISAALQFGFGEITVPGDRTTTDLYPYTWGDIQANLNDMSLGGLGAFGYAPAIHRDALDYSRYPALNPTDY